MQKQSGYADLNPEDSVLDNTYGMPVLVAEPFDNTDGDNNDAEYDDGEYDDGDYDDGDGDSGDAEEDSNAVEEDVEEGFHGGHGGRRGGKHHAGRGGNVYINNSRHPNYYRTPYYGGYYPRYNYGWGWPSTWLNWWSGVDPAYDLINPVYTDVNTVIEEKQPAKQRIKVVNKTDTESQKLANTQLVILLLAVVAGVLLFTRK